MKTSFPGRVFFRESGWYSLVPYAILLATFLAVSNINLKKGYKDGSMEADGKGYYAYLPALFIYHDLSFRFYYPIERVTYSNPRLYYIYLREINGKTINKYYAGTALCMMPFFALGHITTLVLGYPADGYSYYYMVWVHLGALFYLLLGLLSLRRLLRTFDIPEKWIAVTLVTIVFGTNLFYYTLTEYSMSHIYSFTAITCFLLATRHYFLHKEGRALVLAGLILGIIVLIRPVNAIILLSIPFIAGSRNTFYAGLKKLPGHIKFLLPAFLVFTFIASLQLVIYKIQTGHFLVYSYPGEGFDFLHPHFTDMLISYRKGLFVYTPIYLLSLSGFIFLWKQNRYAAISMAGFLVLLTYMFSSWIMWYYGGSFSQRVFVDYLAFFAILIALSLKQFSSGWVRNAYLSITFILVLLCQLQTYQYRHMVIHWSEMTKEMYRENFWKLNP